MSSLRWLNLFRRSAKTKTNRAARKARAKANISFEPLEPRVMLLKHHAPLDQRRFNRGLERLGQLEADWWL